MIRQRDIPRQFYIRDAVYEVKWKRDLTAFIGLPGRTIGFCHEADQIIYVQLGLSVEDRLMVVCHEVLHAIEFEWKIKIPHWLINRIDRPMALFILANLAA